MPSNDDYFDDTTDDAAFAAAIEAAEKSRSVVSSLSKSANQTTPQRVGPVSNATNEAASGGIAIKQPVPQKISRPAGFSSIIVNTRQVNYIVLCSTILRSSWTKASCRWHVADFKTL